MKNFFKLTSLAALFVLILSFGTTVFADSPDEIYVKSTEDDFNQVIENYNVTEINPDSLTDSEITPYGTTIPAASAVHNISMHGQMDFNGVASYSALYTNKYFTGYYLPQIHVHNTHSYEKLVVQLFNKGGIFPIETWEIGPGYRLNASPVVDPNQNYYLKFLAPSNFTGYVK